MSVATPESTADVVDLITDARLTGLPLWFAGSGTSPVPDGHTVVSTSKLMGIVDYRPDDLTVVVRCGTTLAELDAVLSEHGHTAVLPEAAGHRTVGGVVASGASGYRRLRYGPTRDRVIGATIVTGYGEIVHAGGQLVKNVTGYDLPRLMTGSRGALGFISDVSLKLWPIPKGRRTVSVDNVADARVEVYQPIAALETEAGGFLHISDSTGEDEGFSWPEPMTGEVVRVVNVPPRLVPDAVARVKASGATRFVAQHGVGVVKTAWAGSATQQLDELRVWTESCGGSIPEMPQVPESIGIQRRLKVMFDPDRICNPGVLPGGV